MRGGQAVTLERVCRNIPRARDAVIAQCSEVEGQRENMEQKKLSKEKEELLRHEAMAKLAGEQERRAHAEAETRAAQAALRVEAEQRRAQDARVAILGDGIARLSLGQPRLGHV